VTDATRTCLEAGFTLFTIDPSDHVRDAGEHAGPERLRGMLGALPWDALDDTPEGLVERYADRPIELEDRDLVPTADEVLRAAAKYGAAVAHTAAMFRHLDAAAPHDGFEASHLGRHLTPLRAVRG